MPRDISGLSSRAHIHATCHASPFPPNPVRSRTSYYGVRVSPSAGSLLQQLLFGFFALGVACVAALRSGNMLHKVAID
eukprot:7061932-Prymnesium_polylepis.1